MKLAEIRKLIAADPATQFAHKPGKYDETVRPLYVVDAEHKWHKTSHWNRRTRPPFTIIRNQHVRHTEVLCAVQETYYRSQPYPSWKCALVALGQIVRYDDAAAEVATRNEEQGNGQTQYTAAKVRALVEAERLVAHGLLPGGAKDALVMEGPAVKVSSWGERRLASGIVISIEEAQRFADLLDGEG